MTQLYFDSKCLAVELYIYIVVAFITSLKLHWKKIKISRKIFKDHGLNIAVESNLKATDYADVTFYLLYMH